jgi:hypothetical protein
MAASANSGVHQLVQHWLRTHAVCEVSLFKNQLKPFAVFSGCERYKIRGVCQKQDLIRVLSPLERITRLSDSKASSNLNAYASKHSFKLAGFAVSRLKQGIRVKTSAFVGGQGNSPRNLKGQWQINLLLSTAQLVALG